MSKNSAPGQPYARLRTYNLIMGALHAVQAIAILALSNSFGLPITTAFMTNAPGLGFPAPEQAFKLALGPAVALFIAISAVAHFIIASPLGYSKYVDQLRRGMNLFRWYEYALSSSLMIVLIVMLNGVTDLGALIAIFGVNASMLFFGLLMETRNEGREKLDWSPFIFGCITGAVPWLIVAINCIGSERASAEGVPGFVYGIIISLFLFFNSFALNMYLQYKKVGPWKDYLFGERAYVLLSLLAKSALAWQVFTATLID